MESLNRHNYASECCQSYANAGCEDYSDYGGDYNNYGGNY